jgi:hypothetical protein
MSNTQIFTIAVMSAANEVRGAEKKSVKYFLGELVEIGCSFTRCTDTYCIRLSSFFNSEEEVQKTELIPHIVVEQGPLVIGKGIKYYPSKSCISPINQWALEKRFNKRIKK